MRKVIQIAASPGTIIALCDDGTLWRLTQNGGWDEMMRPPGASPSSPSSPSPLSDSPPIHTNPHHPHEEEGARSPYVCAGAKGLPVSHSKSTQLKLISTPQSLPDHAKEFVDYWNGFFSLTRIHVLGKRIELINAAFRNEYFRENWKEGIKKLVQTPFCMGKNKRGWKAGLQWFLDPENLDKLLSGQYDSKKEGESPDWSREEI